MAVLNSQGKPVLGSSQSNTVAAGGNFGRPELKSVDLNATGLKAGKKSKLDPTEDAWANSAPPPKGEYTLKVYLAKDGMKMGLIKPDDEDSVFYEAELETKIKHDNPEYDNFTVFSRVSTKIGRGKNISTMAGLINKMGYKLPEEATPLQIAKLLKAAIAKEPVLYNNMLDWSGWSQNDNKVICTSMDDFPEDEEGNPVHEFTITNKDGGREKIQARVKIRVWGSKKANPIAAGKPNGKAVVEDTEEAEEAPANVKPVSAKTGKTAAPAAPKGPSTGKPKAKAQPEPDIEEETEEVEEVAAATDEEELALDED